MREYASYIKDSMVAELTESQPQSDDCRLMLYPCRLMKRYGKRKNRLLGVGNEYYQLAEAAELNNTFRRPFPYDMNSRKRK